jgi:hypothetical protein
LTRAQTGGAKCCLKKDGYVVLYPGPNGPYPLTDFHHVHGCHFLEPMAHRPHTTSRKGTARELAAMRPCKVCH